MLFCWSRDSSVTLSYVVLLVKRQFSDLVLCRHAGKDHRHAAAWDPSITARHAGPGKERRISATFWSRTSPHATCHVASPAFVTIATAQLWEINFFFALKIFWASLTVSHGCVLKQWWAGFFLILFFLFFIYRPFVHVAKSLTLQLCFPPQWPWGQQKWHWLKPFLLKCCKFLPFSFLFSLQNFQNKKVRFLA